MNIMQNQYVSRGMVVALMASLLVLVGCASDGARRIDPSGPDTVVSLNKIDIQDWMDAAQEMTDSLLTSEVLQNRVAQSGDKPVIIAISRIKNDTAVNINTSMLTQKIETNLRTASQGRVLPTMTIGLDGKARDPLAKGEIQRNEFFNDGDESDDAPKQLRPNYTLSGQIIEDRAKAGSTRQTSYIFQLTLTDTRTGAGVWGDEKIITKQGKKNAVGW